MVENEVSVYNVRKSW